MNIDNGSGSSAPRLCLLSLDGGGIRGLSSILLLRCLMQRINQGRTRDSELRPWQVFDLMGGTSTGGLIAIMLGRLRMTLEECENAYIKLSRECFVPKRSKGNILARARDGYRVRGRFSTEALESAILKLLEEKGEQDALMKDDRDGCKVFVTSILKQVSRLVLLRTYTNCNPKVSMLRIHDTCRIWEACRATTAATSFFDEITIGHLNQTFSDGGVMKNNPVELVLQEAKLLYPERINEALVVSIGTGGARIQPVIGNIKHVVTKALVSMLTQTRETHQEFSKRNSEMIERNLYFRFDVEDDQLKDVKLYEVERIDEISSATEGYTDDHAVSVDLETCSKQVLARFNAVIPDALALIENCSDLLRQGQFRAASEGLAEAVATINHRESVAADAKIRILALDARLKYARVLMLVKSPTSLYEANQICRVTVSELAGAPVSNQTPSLSVRKRYLALYLVEKALIQQKRAAHYARAGRLDRARRCITNACDCLEEAIEHSATLLNDRVLCREVSMEQLRTELRQMNEKRLEIVNITECEGV